MLALKYFESLLRAHRVLLSLGVDDSLDCFPPCGYPWFVCRLDNKVSGGYKASSEVSIRQNILARKTEHYPGRNYDKTIPWNTFFASYTCIFFLFENNLPENFLVFFLPLVYVCLLCWRGRPRDFLC